MTPARRRRRRVAGAGLAVLFALALGAPLRAEPMRLVTPPGGRARMVTWRRTPAPPAAVAPRDTAAAFARWSRLLTDRDVQPAALRALARLRLARRDTTGADSCWRALAGWRSIWQWEARQGVARLLLARGAAAAADSVLEGSDRTDWPEADRGAWLAMRVETRLALADTATAVRFARQAIAAYPAAPAARGALATLTACLAAQRQPLAVADERAAAEVDVFRGRRTEAAARLAALARRATTPADRFGALLRQAEVLRTSRKYGPARIAAREAQRVAPDSDAVARALLEQARDLRDGRRPDSAFTLYETAAGQARSSALAALANWEWAKEAEDQGRWQEALGPFRRAAAFAGERASEARFRVGLMHFLAGSPDSACTWWERSTDEGSRFWWAISQRRSQRARADSMLRAIALTPGVSFYRGCARDTLGLRPWPGLQAADDCGAAAPTPGSCAPIRAAEAMLAAGFADDAMKLLSRWLAGDARAGTGVPTPGQVVAAASIAFRADQPMPAGVWIDRAVQQATRDSVIWAIAPWSYPPAYAELFARFAVDSIGLDRWTLQSLARQESRFEKTARSATGALGLMQFVRATAGDLARSFRDPRPTEARLFRPEVSIRYGARYMTWLLRRFDGHLGVALAAYNAGPGTIPPWWRDLIAAGGEAMFCEIASNADSQDYARKILGYREAYREFRPVLAP